MTNRSLIKQVHKQIKHERKNNIRLNYGNHYNRCDHFLPSQYQYGLFRKLFRYLVKILGDCLSHRSTRYPICRSKSSILGQNTIEAKVVKQKKRVTTTLPASNWRSIRTKTNMFSDLLSTMKPYYFFTNRVVFMILFSP
jgi:hypothetical protein